MAKIMITGAGGYIGSVSTYVMLQAGHEVVAVDNFTTGYHQPLELLSQKFPGKLKIYEKNISTDLEEVLTAEPGIEAVLHYAASCLVDESMKNPDKYFTNNTVGSLHLLETIMKHNIKKIVFSSTCAVYGNAQKVPLDETHPTNPLNPYGESKRMVEKMIEWFGKQNGLNYVIFRYFNVCGASDDGLIGDSKKPSSLLVQNVVRGALGIEPFFLTCGEVDTPDKSPIRDYVNVVDLNEAHKLALDYLLKGGASQFINLGTGAGNSVLEIVKQVEKDTGATIELKKTAAREGEYAVAIADITKAKTILGWQPKRTIADSVKALITWYKAHPHGWEK